MYVLDPTSNVLTFLTWFVVITFFDPTSPEGTVLTGTYILPPSTIWLVFSSVIGAKVFPLSDRTLFLTDSGVTFTGLFKKQGLKTFGKTANGMYV